MTNKLPIFLKDVVVVTPNEPTYGNKHIILPGRHQTHHIQSGRVVALGKKCKLAGDLTIGDNVIIDLYIGNRHTFGEQQVIVYDSADIKGKYITT